MYLYLDIETVPTNRADVIARMHLEAMEAARNAEPPKNYTKPESIEKWRRARMESAEDEAREQHHKTGLDGGYGHIVCVSWAIDDGDVESISIASREQEPSLISDLWARLRQQCGQQRVVFVGHNIEFDLRFLRHRSVITGYRPSVHLPYNAAPWRGDYVDTMYEWCGARGSVKLMTLCDMLQIATTDNDIDGSEVWDAYQAGHHEAIRDHCEADVHRVRKIHKRLRYEADIPTIARQMQEAGL